MWGVSYLGKGEANECAHGALTLVSVLGILVAQVENVLEGVTAFGWVGELVDELPEKASCGLGGGGWERGGGGRERTGLLSAASVGASMPMPPS